MSIVMPIVSVNTCGVAVLGEFGGREILSGIRKSPVLGGGPLRLDFGGLEGDQQANPKVHGAAHGQAVYVYPRRWYPDWAQELDQALQPGAFGENLTVDDYLEHDIVIGERWRWGSALLEVTKPRTPCRKLDMLRGEGTSVRMLENGRCGWYLTVIEEGVVPTVGALTRVFRPEDTPTVLDVFREKTKTKVVHAP